MARTVRMSRGQLRRIIMSEAKKAGFDPYASFSDAEMNAVIGSSGSSFTPGSDSVEDRAEELYQQAVEDGFLDDVIGPSDDEDDWDPADSADRVLNRIADELADEGELDDDGLQNAVYEKIIAGLT